MDAELRSRLVAFVRPLYQDLDGGTRFEDVERVSRIARRLHSPSDPEESKTFETLLLFQGLGSWMGRPGNASRTRLSTGMSDQQIHLLHRSLRRLEAPESSAEIAVASAVLIDESGLRGLTQAFARSRRDGTTPSAIVKEELTRSAPLPCWVTDQVRSWIDTRATRRREVCLQFLDEEEGSA